VFEQRFLFVQFVGTLFYFAVQSFFLPLQGAYAQVVYINNEADDECKHNGYKPQGFVEERANVDGQFGDFAKRCAVGRVPYLKGVFARADVGVTGEAAGGGYLYPLLVEPGEAVAVHRCGGGFEVQGGEFERE